MVLIDRFFAFNRIKNIKKRFEEISRVLKLGHMAALPIVKQRSNDFH